MTDYVFLVEGDTDDRFVNEVIAPEIGKTNVTTFKYSQELDEEVNRLVTAMQNMYNNFHLLRDYDYGKQDCTSLEDRKEFVTQKFPSTDNDEIIIVKDAIEGWYVAGIEESTADEFGISLPGNTENVGKSEFEELLESSNLSSALNFQREIVQQYSLEVAKSNNSSFRYLSGFLGL